MGVLDLFRRKKDVATTKTALEAARDPQSGETGAVSSLIRRILDLGLDGKGPLDSASEVADKALRKSRETDKAVDAIVRQHTVTSAGGGFLTSLGGFVTMPVALPANVLEFYVTATRMVGAIAKVRGYDLSRDEVRTAVLLTLVGSHADEVLAKAGISTASGRVTSMVLGRLPQSALMIVNKAVGFRVLKSVAGMSLSRLGKAIPVLGGLVGAGLDATMMRRIAKQARQEFPQQ